MSNPIKSILICSLPMVLIGMLLPLANQAEPLKKRIPMRIVNAGDPRHPDFPTGPAVGEAVPNFALSDQFGKTLHYAQYRGKNKALILFYRSASW